MTRLRAAAACGARGTRGDYAQRSVRRRPPGVQLAAFTEHRILLVLTCTNFVQKFEAGQGP